MDSDQPWDVDAPATARLREAGAVLVGKTTTPEFGCKGETNSRLTASPATRGTRRRRLGDRRVALPRPWPPGSAPLSIGTDGAGSVRIPAAFCGNVGLKPSFGRVPAYPLSPFGTVSHLGPHTMSVADAALMMNVLKRPDAAGLDVAAAGRRRLPRGPRRRESPGLRVAFSPTLGYAEVHPEVAAAVAAAATQLERRRGAVEEASTPGSRTRSTITTGLWFTGAWTLWNTLTPEQQAVTDPDFAAEAELGSELSNLDVQRLDLRRGELGSPHAPVDAATSTCSSPRRSRCRRSKLGPPGTRRCQPRRCSDGRRSRIRST